MMSHAAECDPVSLSAAFVVGLAGSVHCLAMCGGISGALAMRHASHGDVLPAVVQQLGRLSSYALAGAIVGGCSGLLYGLLDMRPIAVGARVLAGVLLLSVGLGRLCRWRPSVGVERLGAHLWRRLAPLAGKLPQRGMGSALLLGMLWGWLPCGFVYSMLAFAALKGGAVQAGATMLCFGLGTAPAVFGAGWFSVRGARVATARSLNYLSGCLLLVFGTLTILGPWYPHDH